MMTFETQPNLTQLENTLHYSEFDGKIIVKNRCTEHQTCHGFDESENEIIILCDDMPIHGGCDIENFDE